MGDRWMKGWKECKLGEIAEIIGGGTPSTEKKEYWDGNIPWLTPRDLTGYKKIYISKGARNISELGLQNSSTKILPKGSVLITSRAPIGYVAIAANSLCTNQGFKSLIPNNNIVSNLFLYYWVKNNIEYLKSVGTGTTFEEISGSVLKEIPILLPPLEEQRAIAEVLSSLDDKIDLLHRQNKTLEAMAETLFRQWYVERSVYSRSAKITKLVDFYPQRQLSKGTVAPYLDMANVNTSVFHPENWYNREFTSGTKFINGDTLLARITPCLENGKSTYVTFLDDNQVGWGSTEFIVMRSKPWLHTFFTYTLVKNRDFIDYAIGCFEGSSGRQRVNVDHLCKYELYIPQESIIKLFNQIASSFVPKLIHNFRQIRVLTMLRDTLLPKLMSGEVRVKI